MEIVTVLHFPSGVRIYIGGKPQEHIASIQSIEITESISMRVTPNGKDGRTIITINEEKSTKEQSDG